MSFDLLDTKALITKVALPGTRVSSHEYSKRIAYKSLRDQIAKTHVWSASYTSFPTAKVLTDCGTWSILKHLETKWAQKHTITENLQPGPWWAKRSRSDSTGANTCPVFSWHRVTNCIDVYSGLAILVRFLFQMFHVRTAHYWKQDLDLMHINATKS